MRANTTTYCLYGTHLDSPIRFRHAVPSSNRAADVALELVSTPLPVSNARPIYTSTMLAADGGPFLTILRGPCGPVLRYSGVAEFAFSSRVIHCRPILAPDDPGLENLFIGEVLALWLERQGTLCLHGSAVIVDGRAAVFLADSGGGKSTLAASFVACGYHLLSDDIVPLAVDTRTVTARPGYPQMRMWPEQARVFVDDWEALHRVHPAFEKLRVPVGHGVFGNFHGQPEPVGAVYVAERRQDSTPTPPSVTRLAEQDAFVQLVRHSYAAPLLEALGMQSERMPKLAQLVREIGVTRLRYDSGYDRLGEVREELLRSAGPASPRP